MEIYLVRHGQVKVINGEYFKSHLSPDGIKQGQNILSKGLLPKPDKVYSSHFIRAKESAKLMADYFSMDFEVKGCLGEWKIQEMNLPMKEYILEEEKARKDMDKIVTGGESMNMAQNRIYDCLKSIVTSNPHAKRILLISHGNVLYLLFHKILGSTPIFDKNYEEIKNFGYGVIDYSNGTFSVVKNIITVPGDIK